MALELIHPYQNDQCQGLTWFDISLLIHPGSAAVACMVEDSLGVGVRKD